jgi:hypothetical protein
LLNGGEIKGTGVITFFVPFSKVAKYITEAFWFFQTISYTYIYHPRLIISHVCNASVLVLNASGLDYFIYSPDKANIDRMSRSNVE